MTKATTISIIGLGYVGLPLAVEFARHYEVRGFDINSARIDQLNSFIDKTKQLSEGELRDSQVTFTSDVKSIAESTIFIITVPTPIDHNKQPDLSALLEASETVASVLKKGDVVIYESTVYPGCTEEECVPVLENTSGLKANTDFFYGYSPERISPGDPVHTLTSIVKVTSGSTPEYAIMIDELYKKIITAGTYLASSIKVAEASKAIENAQRDINISFVNELALIFDRIGIDTQEVLDAAGTKWNFLKFKPGLVGGHCISVDPYYLTHKAEKLGYFPEVILSGRRVNEHIPEFIATKVVKMMLKKEIVLTTARVLLLGFTFKENCPDTRNSKVMGIYNEFIQFGVQVDIYDPLVDSEEVRREYGIEVFNIMPHGIYAAVVLCVAHDEFNSLNFEQM
ncbi:MAG: nucleotide sugar dehydrogenase, partial [Daejeonella sp.]|uniref:nucleotide sugar dehydrogenase n=1 Tax=Daejeonella sp. TaxID=2805397 RepID=UPI003C748359